MSEEEDMMEEAGISACDDPDLEDALEEISEENQNDVADIGQDIRQMMAGAADWGRDNPL